ncbi:MAG: hypothetical protein OXC27_02990 [Caldilineaceae bacterium]|nr:hypothetical protein [Caldilineaceae bacterium]
MQGTAGRIAQRIRQFVRGVTASVSVDELQEAARFLPPAGLSRFRQMPVDAQRHSLNVLTTLQGAGWHDPDLAAAALLHDAGKLAAAKAGLTFNAWVRTALVLLDTFAPTLAARLAVEEAAGGWRYLLHVHLAHPLIGAHWADADGCSPLTCWLIARHQDKTSLSDPPSNSVDGPNRRRTAGEVARWSEVDEPHLATEERMRLLRALQWADSQN